MPPYDYFPDTMPYEQVVSIHLAGNFYPPLPQEYVPLAVEARQACIDGDPDRIITIPPEVEPKPREGRWLDDNTVEIRAAHLLDVLRLDTYDEDEETA